MDYRHVEITGRQIGKTNRLVEKLIEDYYSDKGEGKYMIVASSKANKQELLNRLKEKDKTIFTMALSQGSGVTIKSGQSKACTVFIG